MTLQSADAMIAFRIKDMNGMTSTGNREHAMILGERKGSRGL